MASRGLAAWAMLGERVSRRARRDEMELRCIFISKVRGFVGSRLEEDGVAIDGSAS